MVLGQLTGGGSLSDPALSAGIALGLTCLGGAALVNSRGRLAAAVTWLGIAAVVVAIGVFGSMVIRTPRANVITLYAIPSAIFLTAAIAMARARIRAGALGGPSRIDPDEQTG